MARKIFITCGTLCFLYGIVVLSIIGGGALFNWFYLCLGALLVFLGRSFRTGKDKKTRDRAVCVIAAVCAFVFIVTEAAIVLYPIRGPEAAADYVILLGTQMREDGPSVDFKARILAAYSYMKENPESLLIATGGKGEDELVSEAEGAVRYLSDLGIPEERMIAEDSSRNTQQNIENSYRLIEANGDAPSESRIVIVSAAYHLMRACYIASQNGFRNISVKGSVGNILIQPHFYTREFFALIKEIIVFSFLK